MLFLGCLGLSALFALLAIANFQIVDVRAARRQRAWIRLLNARAR